ncbi:MAG: hypothetical protein L6V78_02810 [Clostridium sp.]|nr:MAG: hypothetical protein L6V78_02810 [Clostridium sp.]
MGYARSFSYPYIRDISSTISAAIVISLVDLNVGAIISNESSFGVTLNSRLVKIFIY